MNEILLLIGEFLLDTLLAVKATLLHNWKILAFGILLAVALKTYVNSEKLSKALVKRSKISILASVAFGAFTPLCACGTTAVIVGMMTTALPWGPIMAFLTSSPLMSPDGFVLISGVIGLRFAIALTIASIVIGIGSGFITNIIEKRTKILEGQSRFTEKKPSCTCGSVTEEAVNNDITTGCGCSSQLKDNASKTACSCSEVSENIHENESEGCSCEQEHNKELSTDTCNCGSEKKVSLQNNAASSLKRFAQKYKVREFASGLYTLGFKQILVFYAIFVAVGFMINYFIPSSIITVLFGANSFYAVPLASIIGLPLYITTDSGIPIIQSMLSSGASEGAMLAFMITGSATSAWVIAGLSTFMKKRALALYFVFVLMGGIISGYVYDLIKLLL